MKSGIIACCALAIVWVVLAVIQLWFAPLAGETFVKITITLALAFTVVLLLSLVVREYMSEKNMKDSGHIDS